MTLKDLIIEYRNDHGLSQRQFATACGLSNGYISMLEKEMNPNTKLPVTPTLPKLKQLASGMGMSLTDLLVKVDDMPVELILDDADSKKLVPEIEDELGCRDYENYFRSYSGEEAAGIELYSVPCAVLRSRSNLIFSATVSKASDF